MMRCATVRPLAAFALLLTLAGCAVDPVTGQSRPTRAGQGAAVGAALGAVIGALTEDDSSRERRKRALIGAGVGALAGAGVGSYMDREERRLRDELAGTGVSVERVGDRIVLNMPGNITFATDSSDVSADFYPVLNSVARVLDEYESTLIDVAGHTDSTGSSDYNAALSQRRADSVARYLTAQGVDGRRVFTRGFGEDYPTADNGTAEGRRLNRRVELVLEPIVAG
ncbi:MAG: OmpA family protein [Pseudomonadales bacterium]|jgi:outer membrane protein OmpA-like peptidoglycan-associated protein|nr:OmpA family protein [Pseudomonadales bacterium]